MTNTFYIVVLTFVFLLVSPKMVAQENYQTLVENCYRSLELQDSISFVEAYPKLWEAYLRENDSYYHINKELEKRYKLDQSLRLLYMDSRRKRGNNDDLTRKLRTFIDEMDKKNAVYAKSILLKHGWLTTDEISSEANEGLFIIVQHCADTEVQSLCLLLIDKILAEHPEERWHYAFLTDRFAMNQGADQIYGTQKIIQEGYPYPIPLKYPIKVDSLRATVGLPPFWTELNEEYNSDWSLEKYLLEEMNLRKRYENYIQKNLLNKHIR